MQKNKQMQKNKRQNVKNVRSVIRQTVTGYAGLSLGIVLAVAGAIVTALLPPWILGSIVDTITAGNAVPVALVILYFAFTVLTGLTESLREGLLTVFGQKITPRTAEQHDGEIHEPDGRGTDETGARYDRIPVRGRCGYGGEPVYLRNHQHVRRCL